MDAVWHIELFNGLRATCGKIEITRFRTQKTAALFAYLIYFPQVHSREVIAEMLWPESPTPKALSKLHVPFSVLRRQFEPPGSSQGSVIQANRLQVRIRAEAVTTDVREFVPLSISGLYFLPTAQVINFNPVL